MKKLAIVQIILGALIGVSFIYWIGWLTVSYHFQEEILALNVWTILYPLLGLSVLICGIVQFSNPQNAWLILTQIVLGIFIFGSMIWFIRWVEPWTRIMEEYGEIEIMLLPGWFTTVNTWRLFSLILGMSVLGVGVAQLVKVRAKRKSL